MTGLELAARLHEKLPALPMILLSGNLTPEAVAAASTLGIREVLNKPVNMQELLASVERALVR